MSTSVAPNGLWKGVVCCGAGLFCQAESGVRAERVSVLRNASHVFLSSLLTRERREREDRYGQGRRCRSQPGIHGGAMRKEPASASLRPHQPCRPDAPRCKRQSARRWRPPAAGRRRPHGRRRAANGDVVHGKRRGCAPNAATAGHRASRHRVASWRRVATVIVADAATATVQSLSGRAAAVTTSPRSPPPRTGGVRVDEGPPPRPARGRRRSRPPSAKVAQPMLSSPHPPPLPSYVVHLPTSLPRSGPPARSRPRNQLSPPSGPETQASPP